MLWRARLNKVDIILTIEEYLYWKGAEEEFPSAGFAKPRKKAENELRKIVRNYNAKTKTKTKTKTNYI